MLTLGLFLCVWRGACHGWRQRGTGPPGDQVILLAEQWTPLGRVLSV